jgi:hypothetical protein
MHGEQPLPPQVATVLSVFRSLIALNIVICPLLCCLGEADRAAPRQGAAAKCGCCRCRSLSASPAIPVDSDRAPDEERSNCICDGAVIEGAVRLDGSVLLRANTTLGALDSIAAGGVIELAHESEPFSHLGISPSGYANSGRALRCALSSFLC